MQRICNVLVCSLQFITAFYKIFRAPGDDEPKEELKKQLSAFENYLKQNDKHLGGEPNIATHFKTLKKNYYKYPKGTNVVYKLSIFNAGCCS